MEMEHVEAKHFRHLEVQMLQHAVRCSPHKVGNLLADEFVEFGSSGRTFDKRETVEILKHERPLERTVANFRARRLASGVVLVTYDLLSTEQRVHSLRSSIWKRIDGRWQMVFHQGTPAAPDHGA